MCWRRSFILWGSGQRQVVGQAELLPVLVAKMAWPEDFVGRPVVTFIDNDSVCYRWLHTFDGVVPRVIRLGRTFDDLPMDCPRAQRKQSGRRSLDPDVAGIEVLMGVHNPQDHYDEDVVSRSLPHSWSKRRGSLTSMTVTRTQSVQKCVSSVSAPLLALPLSLSSSPHSPLLPSLPSARPLAPTPPPSSTPPHPSPLPPPT